MERGKGTKEREEEREEERKREESEKVYMENRKNENKGD